LLWVPIKRHYHLENKRSAARVLGKGVGKLIIQ